MDWTHLEPARGQPPLKAGNALLPHRESAQWPSLGTSCLVPYAQQSHSPSALQEQGASKSSSPPAAERLQVLVAGRRRGSGRFRWPF